jgi:hypothetical protein
MTISNSIMHTTFLFFSTDQLIKLPAPEAAINYYMNEDLYLFGRPLLEHVYLKALY